MLLGKTFSFTPDEANVDDLAKACDYPIIYSLLLRILTFVSYAKLANRMRNLHAFTDIIYHVAHIKP